MIVVSANTATNLVLARVGLTRVNQTLAAWGFPQTRLLRPFDFPTTGREARNQAITTPGELAAIMEALATGTILTPASRLVILPKMPGIV